MAKEVTKKDGIRQPFAPEKIKNSILAAAREADLPEERKNEVAEQVASTIIQLAESQEEITTSELREKTLAELDKVEPSIAEAWRKYDKEKKGI